ncbi:hypothetical protein PILCRDRAFT_327167 [Piloderma croceum F 1598]|uniref:Uncharacterized protein n=1 Tax=Piloderma croceum (strain F 1598) TaxID=765440 RepID=A0A0C3FQP7_PILCF|nr:hypothetical protein PILCRDRAFT_327167 [Piloderma croceum F 1598]
MTTPLPAEPGTNWELLSRTAPDQFVAALRAGAGDAPTLDFIYGFVAVHALCECVIQAKTRPLDPISRSRWRIETSNSTSSTSSYYSFFEMLRSIAEKFSEPPSQVDLKVIQVLGTYWSQMMKRVGCLTD